MEWLGYAAAFAAGMLFAVSDVLVRMAGGAFRPRVLLALSVLVGTPLLLALALASGDPFPRGRPLQLYMLAGVLNFVIGRLLFYIAVVGAGATTASIATSPTVLLSALLAWALLGEALEPRLLAGLLLVMAGVYLASSRPSGESLHGVRPLLGVVAGVAASLVFASTSVLVRAAGMEASPLWGVTVSYATALPIVLVLASHDAGGFRSFMGLVWSRRRHLAYAALAAIVVGLAQASRYVSLHYLPVARAVILISLFPVHTVAFTALLSGEARERVGLRHLASALLGFTGVAVAYA